jgi:class 3 adenylate cyclase/tetratricopeptide (TPR) repeat protein
MGAKFCKRCGQRLGGPQTAQAAPGPRFGSLESYTPKHLAEKILTSKSALEGERKQVTVLFADLKGSMELLADRDPEEARKLLDPVLERMMEAVHHYEGTVNQVMGDGIMALFGAPLAHEDHAVRACYAALRMQRRVTLYADELQRGGGTPVQIRVGLHSGEVVVRSIGSDLHMDYTAVGQTTHLAARMEQMAKPGSALVTGETLKLAEGYVQVRPLGAVPVKGLETPAAVYELNGIVPAQSRFQASTARGLTRFVGRDSELQQLAQALERAAAGHGQAVAVVGEAGVGKSRLAWEFTRSHRTHGWLLLESGSVSHGKVTPYLPVIDLLKAYCGVQERDDPRAIRERVAGKLLMLDRALEPLLTPLLALLDVPVSEASWDALDPPQRRQRTLEAVKRLLLRESQVQPLLVIFEDLHWIDTETQALLDGLMESLPTARILLLVNYRPEYQHAWGSKTYYTQFRIDPLPPESAEAVLQALLGEDRTLEPLKRVLVERTEGNPFFLEESVRTLVETRVLVGERRAYRLAKAPDAWQIPVAAQAILAARIDRLAPEDKRLLQAAAVIGKDVSFALLQAIGEMPEDGLRRGLGRLQAAEFLYETSLFPELEYTFKHALTQEVAYGSLLSDRRRDLHARIIHALERLYPDRLAEHVERLAHHAILGEVWQTALHYLRESAARAIRRSADREAVASLDRAFAVMRHLPQSRDLIEQAIDLKFTLRGALFQLGEFSRIVEVLHEAEGLARELNDQRRLGRVLFLLSTNLWITGRHPDALESGQRALTITTSQDPALQAEAESRLAWVYHAMGDYPRAMTLLQQACERFEDTTIQERLAMMTPRVNSWAMLIWSLGERGEFSEGTRVCDAGLRVARMEDRPFSDMAIAFGIGVFRLRKGDVQQGIAQLERARSLATRFWLCWIDSFLGYGYVMTDRADEAILLLEQTLADATSIGFVAHSSLTACHLGQAHLRVGRLQDASQQAGRALDLAREHGERAHEAYALRLMGELTANPNRFDGPVATAHYGKALALATELGMRPLMAHCHLGLGTLYRRTGNGAKAHEHLTTAMTMYREMGMGFWLEKAEAEIKGPA